MIQSRWWLVVQAVVTVVLLVLLMRTVDLAALKALFLRVPVWFYLASLGVVLAGQVAYAWRWWLLLTTAGVQASFTTVVRQYFIGLFVNNFLPSTMGGDLAKVYYLGPRHGYRTVTASIAVDRLLGVGLLALLASVAFVVAPIAAPRLTAAHLACAAVAITTMTLLMLTSVGTGGLPARVTRFGERAVMLAERLQRLRRDMAAPLRRPAIIAMAAGVVIGYACAVTVVYMRFVALHHETVPPFSAMLAVVTAITVLSNVPIALNGLGLREQLHASLLAPLGISLEIAVAISLLLYVHFVVTSLIGFVFWVRAPVVSSEAAAAP